MKKLVLAAFLGNALMFSPLVSASGIANVEDIISYKVGNEFFERNLDCGVFYDFLSMAAVQNQMADQAGAFKEVSSNYINTAAQLSIGFDLDHSDKELQAKAAELHLSYMKRATSNAAEFSSVYVPEKLSACNNLRRNLDQEIERSKNRYRNELYPN
ncbi:hypothetical protein ACNKU7_18275 [Microbulbifer sp. SA54]|uniref:hypothetical protein n=1 Tax=Microbulbifer sp. SA54 TaxID=3401577 RepID=UPI003AABD27D